MVGVTKKYMPNKLLAVGIVIPILILVIPIVYASESNDKRYSDGYSNWSDAELPHMM
jgi:hypothetical protein